MRKVKRIVFILMVCIFAECLIPQQNINAAEKGKIEFTLECYGKGQIVLSYKKVPDAEGLEVYCKEKKDAEWEYISEVENKTNTLYLTGFKKNSTCYFKMVPSKIDDNGLQIRGESVEKSIKVVYKSTKMKKGDYKKGSIYGPSLTTKELTQVKKEVQKFLNENIVETMSDYQKASIAHDYLVQNCKYASSWAKNNANSAWGALVYHEAQCSGYARAYKALCDGMGIGCYYVHASQDSVNASHQFNIVKVGKKWYIVDVQGNDSSNFNVAYFCSAKEYKDLGIRWDESKYPKCKNNYLKEQAQNTQPALSLSETELILYSNYSKEVPLLGSDNIKGITGEFTWISSDPSVVSVESKWGRAFLTPHKKGVATITYRHGDYKAYCKVVVKTDKELIKYVNKQYKMIEKFYKSKKIPSFETIIEKEEQKAREEAQAWWDAGELSDSGMTYEEFMSEVTGSCDKFSWSTFSYIYVPLSGSLDESTKNRLLQSSSYYFRFVGYSSYNNALIFACLK